MGVPLTTPDLVEEGNSASSIPPPRSQQDQHNSESTVSKKASGAESGRRSGLRSSRQLAPGQQSLGGDIDIAGPAERLTEEPARKLILIFRQKNADDGSGPTWVIQRGGGQDRKKVGMPDVDEPFEERDYFELVDIEDRLCAAIEYTHSRLGNGKQPQSSSNFTIDLTKPPSPALTLARKAESRGLATFVRGTPTQETYSVGTPLPSQPFGNLDRQWWVGMSRAEQHAGPLAESNDIKEAEKKTKSQLARRKASETKPNGKLKTEGETMGEGLRRQVLELPMYGKLDPEVVEKAMKKHGHKLDAMGVKDAGRRDTESGYRAKK